MDRKKKTSPSPPQNKNKNKNKNKISTALCFFLHVVHIYANYQPHLFLSPGLRSNKPGEQCEAIVRFPSLFEKYPFPILINSAFLKLGDVFRNG